MNYNFDFFVYISISAMLSGTPESGRCSMITFPFVFAGGTIAYSILFSVILLENVTVPEAFVIVSVAPTIRSWQQSFLLMIIIFVIGNSFVRVILIHSLSLLVVCVNVSAFPSIKFDGPNLAGSCTCDNDMSDVPNVIFTSGSDVVVVGVDCVLDAGVDCVFVVGAVVDVCDDVVVASVAVSSVDFLLYTTPTVIPTISDTQQQTNITPKTENIMTYFFSM